MILDPNGKAVSSQELDKCPKCGKGSEERGPSSSFGEPWTICTCGYEFKETPWRPATR